MPKRDPLTPIDMEERIKLPVVWFVVLGLVGAGIVLHIVLAFVIGGGLLIWPFVFAVCVLLLINQAAEENGAGVPPFQAYAMFVGTLVGLFLFVMLVSKTINPWLLIVLVIGAGVYVVRDWGMRKKRQIEIDRRRAAGLCLRCCQPVTNGAEDVCENCGLPVNQERMDLFRLGRAMSMKDRAGDKMRQSLTGSGPKRADIKFQNLQQARAAHYKRRK
jgi:hypothetical protein